MSKFTTRDSQALNAKVAEVLGLPMGVLDFVNDNDEAHRLMIEQKVCPFKSSARILKNQYVIVEPMGKTIYVDDYQDMDEAFRVAICMAVLLKYGVEV